MFFVDFSSLYVTTYDVVDSWYGLMLFKDGFW